MKKIIAASALSFILGVSCSDALSGLKGTLQYDAKEGFAKHPYSLKIVHRETSKGIESYVLDTRTNEYQKIEDPQKKQKKRSWKVLEYLLH